MNNVAFVIGEQEEKPQLGEVRKGRTVGKKNRNSYIWAACLDCGEERWVELREEYRAKN